MKLYYFVFLAVLTAAVMNFGCTTGSLWRNVSLNDRMVAAHCTISEHNHFFDSELLAQRLLNTDSNLHLMLFQSFGCDNSVIYRTYTLAQLEEESSGNVTQNNSEPFCYESNTNTNNDYHINCTQSFESCLSNLQNETRLENIIFYSCRPMSQIQNTPNERTVYEISH